MTFISDYNGAIVWEAHPSNVGVGTNNPKAIVYHTPEEPADGYPGTPYWFAREHPASAGSTHYFSSYLGFIWQSVLENKRAIANGVTADRSYPVGTNSNISLNLQSISIEIEGYAATIGQTLSVAQRKSVVDWTVYACKKYNIPADRQHIIGHYEVASNRSDPGTLPIDSIVLEVAAKLKGEDKMNAEQEAIMKDIQAWLKGPTQEKLDRMLIGAIDYKALAKAVNDDAAARLKE
jgi:hypothetical protein